MVYCETVQVSVDRDHTLSSDHHHRIPLIWCPSFCREGLDTIYRTLHVLAAHRASCLYAHPATVFQVGKMRRDCHEACSDLTIRKIQEANT